MPIINSVLANVINTAENLRMVEVHTDHLGVLHDYRPNVPFGTDLNAALIQHAIEVDNSLAEVEVATRAEGFKSAREDIRAPAEYQDQNDYDRRMLSVMMQVDDSKIFLDSLPFFQDVESRGGPSPNSRATYLGVTRASYNLVADRYGDVQGAAFFINNEKDQIWDQPLPGWE